MAIPLLGAVKSNFMVILILLIVIIAVGILITKKSYDYEVIGIIVSVIAGLYLIIHLLFWSLSGYEYNLFVVKREAFKETLDAARETNNQIELAAITKDISEWNKELATNKYNASLFMLKDYIDKRGLTLEPLR